MLKAKYLILGMVFVVSALTGWVMADDVDDVYYWPDRSPVPPAPTIQTTTTTQTTPTTSQTITYIEDSVTMHSDTIVKAVIHR